MGWEDLTDLMSLHLTSLYRLVTQFTLGPGVELCHVILQLCPGDRLVTVRTERDVTRTVESVHHVALAGDVTTARITAT